MVDPNATEMEKVDRIKEKLNRKFSKVLLGVPFSSVAEMINKAPIYEAAVGEYRQRWERPLPPDKMLQSALGWVSSKSQDETNEGDKGKSKPHPSGHHQKGKGHRNQGQGPHRNPDWQPKKVSQTEVSPSKPQKEESKKPQMTGGNKQTFNRPGTSTTGQVREKLNPIGPDGKPR